MKCYLHKDCWSLWESMCGCVSVPNFAVWVATTAVSIYYYYYQHSINMLQADRQEVTSDMLPGWTMLFDAIILPKVTAWVKHSPVSVAPAVFVMTLTSWSMSLSTSPTTLEMKVIVLSHLAHGRVLAIWWSFHQLHLSNNKKGQGAILITLEPWWDVHIWWSDSATDSPTTLCTITSNPSHLIMRMSCQTGITHMRPPPPRRAGRWRYRAS